MGITLWLTKFRAAQRQAVIPAAPGCG